MKNAIGVSAAKTNDVSTFSARLPPHANGCPHIRERR
jgi:hypothetical protein